MTRYSPTGVSAVAWVPTIANTAAPTVAELTAGVRIEAQIRGLPSIPRSVRSVDVSDLASKFDKLVVGTRGGDTVTFELLRDSTPANETALAAMPEDDEGYLVIARAGIAGADFAAADVVDVLPAVVASLADGSPGRNDADTLLVSLLIHDDPVRGVDVVA